MVNHGLWLCCCSQSLCGVLCCCTVGSVWLMVIGSSDKLIILSPTNNRPATGVLSNIDHQKKTRISTKYRPHSTLSTKYRPQKLLKKRVFTRFATKVRMFIRAGLYPTSQEIHVKQGAGSYFHITSFNGRVIQFRVLRFIIFRIIGKIYQHSKRFWWNIDHFNAISTTNSRIMSL